MCTCVAAILLVPQAELSAHSVSHPVLDGRPGPTVLSVAGSWLVYWDNEEHQGSQGGRDGQWTAPQYRWQLLKATPDWAATRSGPWGTSLWVEGRGDNGLSLLISGPLTLYNMIKVLRDLSEEE